MAEFNVGLLSNGTKAQTNLSWLRLSVKVYTLDMPGVFTMIYNNSPGVVLNIIHGV